MSTKKIPYNQIRDGCRGGQGLFNMEQVKTLNWKDREMYLGYTSKVGFLDKGGKWRKKDWYTHENQFGKEDIQAEQKRVQQEDEKRMRIELGLEKPESTLPKDILTEQEKQELHQKIKTNLNNTNVYADYEAKLNEKKGLGECFENDMNKTKKEANLDYEINPYQLQGNINQDNEIAKLKLIQKMHSKKVKKEKKIKKDKKDKKGKKNKHKEKKSKKQKKQRMDSSE